MMRLVLGILGQFLACIDDDITNSQCTAYYY